MAKKRALSIKAIVTQNSLDSDGNTVVTNKGTYYFPMELFVYDYMEDFLDLQCWGAAPETSTGLKYLMFMGDSSSMLDRLDIIFNRPDTLEDKTLSYKSSDYSHITVNKYNKELFKNNYVETSIDNNKLSSILSQDNPHIFGEFIRYEFLLLSDEAYNKFMEVWKDKITKTLNSIFPDLVGEITLVFTNSATTEE